MHDSSDGSLGEMSALSRYCCRNWQLSASFSENKSFLITIENNKNCQLLYVIPSH